jgi:RimJ/RimL family protein N-acetyltransferase
MPEQPTLSTARLVLRPFQMEDAQALMALIGVREVSDTMLVVPYPYTLQDAHYWINSRQAAYDEGVMVSFAITRRADGAFMGGTGLTFGHERAHNKGEIGYWIGVPFWGQGYTTEAVRAVLAYGFERLGLNRIYASHFDFNPASGRVMQKAGMRYEGTLRDYYRKDERYITALMYAILRADWQPD